MTVDLTRLSQCLRQLENESECEIARRAINPYLLENVIMPFLNGNDIEMSSLDFSQFSSDSIIEANREIDILSDNAGRVSRIMDFFKNAPPTVRKIKAFC